MNFALLICIKGRKPLVFSFCIFIHRNEWPLSEVLVYIKGKEGES